MACVVAMAALIRKLGTMAIVNDPYIVSVVLYGVIVLFLQIDTLARKKSNSDKHLQNRLSRSSCAFGVD